MNKILTREDIAPYITDINGTPIPLDQYLFNEVAKYSTMKNIKYKLNINFPSGGNDNTRLINFKNFSNVYIICQYPCHVIAGKHSYVLINSNHCSVLCQNDTILDCDIHVVDLINYKQQYFRYLKDLAHISLNNMYKSLIGYPRQLKLERDFYFSTRSKLLPFKIPPNQINEIL